MKTKYELLKEPNKVSYKLVYGQLLQLLLKKN